MTAKNSVKIYRENSFYHIYNRGVEKRTIFQDKQDCAVFLSYLKTYLSPKPVLDLPTLMGNPKLTYKEKERIKKEHFLKNYADTIDLLCYALVSNHFHLLIKQSILAINSFMDSLGTRYSMYFNKKYNREGRLFQGVYKAVLVESEDQLLHLSRYIHLNSKTLPSSLLDYLGEQHTPWVKSDIILSYFSKTNPNLSYQNFMGQGRDDSFISKLTLDN
jgi:hypothetical protein